LSNVSGSVDRAVLRLYPVSVAGAGHVNAVALVDQHSWSETTLTWNSRPSSGGMLASWTPVEGKPVEVDVTDAVRKALASGKQLSLRIYAPSKGGGQDIAHYGSKEDNNASLRPALVLASSSSGAVEGPEYAGNEGATLYPVADTYVRDGSYATKNFDREALVVKNSTSSYTRESFVRFNLSNVSGSVDRAVLRLY